MLAITVINHPQILFEDYDEIAAREFDNRDLQRLWSAVLGAAASIGSRLNHEMLTDALAASGHGALVASLDQQVRNSRLWSATAEAAIEDALARPISRRSACTSGRATCSGSGRELQRELAQATEDGDDETVGLILRTLQEVQNETSGWKTRRPSSRASVFFPAGEGAGGALAPASPSL